MSTDKSGSPPCGIYLRIDDFTDMQNLITRIRQMAMVINRSSGYKKNINVVELAFDADKTQEITDLILLLKNEGLVAILSGNTNDFNCLGADGALLHDADQFKAAREKMDKDAIIGINCGASRDSASKAIDLGADYIAINAEPSLISWLSSKTETMIATIGKNITSKNCTVIALAGANFIDASDYIMTYEKGTMQATVNIMHALKSAAQMPDILN